MINLNELETLLAKATPGPWLRHNNPQKWVSTLAPITTADWAENRDNDAECVIALRNYGPWMIERIRTMEAALRKIDREWVEFSAAEQDEWSDGYEDGLGDAAKIARNALKDTTND